MTFSSVQPFLQGSHSFQTDRPRCSVCSNRPRLPGASTRPNMASYRDVWCDESMYTGARSCQSSLSVLFFREFCAVCEFSHCDDIMLQMTSATGFLRVRCPWHRGWSPGGQPLADRLSWHHRSRLHLGLIQLCLVMNAFLTVVLKCCCLAELWRCWLGVWKSIRLVKEWVVRCWRGCLSGERCKWFCVWSSWCRCQPIISCFIKMQIDLTILMLTYLSCPGK